MSEITPGGHRHRTLRVLAETPSTLGEIRSGLGLKGNSGDKHWYRMSKLIEAGFVYSDQGRYHITTSGRQELAYLDNEPEGEISVRVFAR